MELNANSVYRSENVSKSALKLQSSKSVSFSFISVCGKNCQCYLQSKHRQYWRDRYSSRLQNLMSIFVFWRFIQITETISIRNETNHRHFFLDRKIPNHSFKICDFFHHFPNFSNKITSFVTYILSAINIFSRMSIKKEPIRYWYRIENSRSRYEIGNRSFFFNRIGTRLKMRFLLFSHFRTNTLRVLDVVRVIFSPASRHTFRNFCTFYPCTSALSALIRGM